MAIDNDLVLRDGTVALESTEATPTAVDFGGPDLVPLTYVVDILEATDGTDETLDVVIQGSADNSTFVDICTFPQITALTAKAQYMLEAISDLRYRRAKMTVGGTDSPSFHGAMVYVCPAGRYLDK